jgi:predicted amidohydrolase YtcJ
MDKIPALTRAMRFQKCLSLIVLLAFSSSAVIARADNVAERVFFNANIFTGERDYPYAEAVAVRGDKIVAVGSRGEVARSVSANAESVDLHGRWLLPGFIDSHSHSIFGGLTLVSADVTGKVESIADLVAFVAEAKRSGRGMNGDILSVSGLPLAFWSKTDELNANFSAEVYANQPVLLAGMDGHTGWGNRALLRRAEVTKDFISHLSEADRKYYGVDAGLEPNGFGVDAGLRKLQAVLPKPSKERLLEAGRAALQYNHSLGITSWVDPIVDESALTSYRQLADRGELTAHVAGFVQVYANKPAEELASVQKVRQENKDVHNLKIVGVKIFADGVAEFPSQTAAMSKSYRNSGKNGELLFDPKRFAELAIAADRQGLIVHVHAIGDLAVTEALNGIEAARKANGNNGLPHTVTHIQFADPADFPRFRQLGVVAALQLLWAEAGVDTIEILKPYIDPAIYRWQYPARSLLNNGAIIAGASDWPVSTANVFQAIYQAETRKGPEGVLDPSQRMPREAMLYAYTRNSARAMNEQSSIGSIAPGKQADLVLVDRDVLTVPAEELRDTKVVWAMVAGKTVYTAQ